MPPQPIPDGHNDLLSCLWAAGDRDGAAFFDGWNGMVSLPACRAGGMAGGFFAIWIPGEKAGAPDPMATYRAYAPISVEKAHRVTLEQAAILIHMAAAAPMRSGCAWRGRDRGRAGGGRRGPAILHIEGCEGIGAGFGRAACAACGGPAQPWPGVEPRQYLWPWRALQLSGLARYGLGPV